jgi:Mrp family chromosome partitioning ATPase
MEPIDYVGALRRSWRLVAALAILVAIIAVLIPVSHHKKVKAALPYEASALVGSPPPARGSPLRAGVSSTQIAFYANNTTTRQAAASDIGLTAAPAALPAYMIANVVPSTGVTTVGASAIAKRNAPTDVDFVGYGATSAQAVQVVNAYVSETQNAIENALANTGNPKTNGAPSGFTNLLPAQFATPVAGIGKKSPVTSRKIRGLGGLAVGAAIGAALVLLRELLDKRLRTAGRAEANFGFPVIAEIPMAALVGKPAVPGLIPVVDVIRDPLSAGAEAYRMLRMSVMFEGLAPQSATADPFALGLESGIVGLLPEESESFSVGTALEVGNRQVVMVVSPGSEPTRAHVAANLAAIYAEAEQKVIVISTGDLEVGHRRRRGVLSGEIRTEDVEVRLQPSRLENVWRLPLSPFVAKSGELADRAPAIIEAARILADVVIVEVPPLLALHHAEAMAHVVDVALVVAECKFTTFDDAHQAGDLLRRMDAPVLGVVLTNVRLRNGDIRESALFRPAPVNGTANGDRTPAPAIPAGVGAGGGQEPASQTQA